MTVLHPGDVACVGRDERLETLLGSCVAVVLTDPRRTLGAMCHIVHPQSARAGGPQTTDGAGALAAMQAQMRARGIEPRLCEAWVFGGGNMFPALVGEHHVGEANVSWVLDALARDGIHVLGCDVGGSAYRRVAWTVGDQPPSVTSVKV